MSLIQVCENGDVDQASILIEQGSGVNDFDEGGFAPLIYAVFTAQVDACDVFIGIQADANVQARDGYDWIIVCSFIDTCREGLLL